MKKILFVGDSITVGLVGHPSKTDGSSFRGGFLRGRPDIVHVGPFTDPNGLKHGGVGGSTTYSFTKGQAQFVTTPGQPPSEAKGTWIQNFQPDIVHIMLGVNDVISFNESPLDLYNRLKDSLAGPAVEQMKFYNPYPIVLISTICESVTPEEQIRAHALNAKIKTLNETTSDYSIRGVDSAGLFNAALDKLNGKSSVAAGLTVDGTHPTQAGYDLIAKSLLSHFFDGASSGQSSSTSSSAVKVAGAVALGYGLYKLFSG